MKSLEDNSLKQAVHSYLDGELNPENTDELWAELLRSPDLMEYMKTYAALKEIDPDMDFTIFEEPAEEYSQGFSRNGTASQAKVHRMWWNYAAAAAVLLIVGLSGLFYVTSPPESEMLKPMAMIEIDNTRSSAGYAGSDQQIQTAISHSINGEIGQALVTLDSVIDTAEDQTVKSQALILRGVIHYNSSDYELSLIEFERVILESPDDHLLLEQALWYKANAKMHLDKDAEALELMKKVIDIDGAYSRIAQRYVAQLIEVIPS